MAATLKKAKQADSLTIRLAPELKFQIVQEAEKEKRSPSNFGMLLLERGFRSWKKSRRQAA